MSDWSEGYVTDIGYTFGYYAELNPLRARLALLSAGWAAPDLLTQGPACELGMGQGVSVNVHAAASGTPWYATDFNPSQVAFGQELATASGVGALGTRLYDEAFADFCHRTDLPDFSFIGIHGIWSWVSDTNRALMVDFVRRKLRVGGVLYISYNTLPGLAAMVPVRDLLTEHAHLMGAPGQGIASRIDASMAFADRLMACNPLYAQANPQIAGRIQQLKDKGHNYLAHEYFNRDWQPMSFASMARWLAPAKLGYGCSAHYEDNLPALNFSASQAALLQEQTDPQFRESVRDFFLNKQFRRDYWIKGPRRLTTVAQAQALHVQRVMLVVPPDEVVMNIKVPVGEASLVPTVYSPVLAAMADQRVHSIGELWGVLQSEAPSGSIGFAQLIEALLVLAAKGDLVAAQDEATTQRAKRHSQQLNRHILGLVHSGSGVNCLASPVSGGGVVLGRTEQLFVFALQQGQTPLHAPDLNELARFAWSALLAQGQRMVRDGKPLETPQENLAELHQEATAFVAKRLPTLRQLQVLD